MLLRRLSLESHLNEEFDESVSPRNNSRKTVKTPEAASPPRIVGGTLRGRLLPFSPDGRTRPMKDRVRETLFDLIGPEIVGAIAIDLFAGSGSLGFESISRGASKAIFAERHFPTSDLIEKAAITLGISQSVTVKAGNVLLWSKQMPVLDTSARWVVFFSPPWSFFTEKTDEMMALVRAMLLAAPRGSLLVVEADENFDPQHLPSPHRWNLRTIRPEVLYFYGVHNEDSAEADSPASFPDSTEH